MKSVATLTSSPLVFCPSPSSLENGNPSRCLQSPSHPFEEDFVQKYNTLLEENDGRVWDASETSQYKTQIHKKDLLANIFFPSFLLAGVLALVLPIAFFLTMSIWVLLGAVCMPFVAHRFYKWGNIAYTEQKKFTFLAKKGEQASSSSKEEVLLSIHALLSNATMHPPCKDVLRAIFRKVYDQPSNQGFVDDVLGLLKDLKKGFELEKVNQDIECL